MNVKFKINGNEVETKEGITIIEAAKQFGIEIPSLCYHPALQPYGSCRLCLVEVIRHGRSNLTTACTHPVEEGLEILTETEEIIKYRKITLELLLARASDSKLLQDMARDMGIKEIRFRKKDKKCILCGQCVRICQERIGSAAITFAGRGIAREITSPFSEVSLECLGCGACVFVCPTKNIKPEEVCSRPIVPLLSEFNCGLNQRPAIYLSFPQAVPNIPVIDRDNCIRFNKEKCGICEKVCSAGAINYDIQDEVIEEKFGAIIVATGFTQFDHSAYGEYGYGKYKDVITGLHFERMINSSGPTGGKIARPSDGKEARDVVFIQCVGSRDEQKGMPYCSRLCCMYTAKHALLLREHNKDAQAYVFYIDIRAAGKNYEEFVKKVQDEFGAVYLRGRVSRIFQKGGKLIVRGADTLSGAQIEIKADLVVLASGLVAQPDAVKLAQMLHIPYDQNNLFTEAHPKLAPVETITSGIFLTGACQSPKDIPDTVATASAASVKALGLMVQDRLAREPLIANVNSELCSGCLACIGACSFNAIEEEEIRDKRLKKSRIVAKVVEGVCTGCGNCTAVCRMGAIDLAGFSNRQIMEEIEAI